MTLQWDSSLICVRLKVAQILEEFCVKQGTNHEHLSNCSWCLVTTWCVTMRIGHSIRRELRRWCLPRYPPISVHTSTTPSLKSQRAPSNSRSLNGMITVSIVVVFSIPWTHLKRRQKAAEMFPSIYMVLYTHCTGSKYYSLIANISIDAHLFLEVSHPQYGYICIGSRIKLWTLIKNFIRVYLSEGYRELALTNP